jgi:hypothetical protein
MNKNQVTCDDAALEDMLRSDQSSEPSEELLAHVETAHAAKSGSAKWRDRRRCGTV